MRASTLKRIRISRGLSQREMAEQLSINIGYYRDMEYRLRQIPGYVAKRARLLLIIIPPRRDWHALELKALRLDMGLSLDQMAERIGCSAWHLYGCERNIKPIHMRGSWLVNLSRLEKENFLRAIIAELKRRLTRC